MPERAANTQIGWEGRIAPRLKLSVDGYFNYITDAIESVNITVPVSTTQYQNVGLERAIGADFKADYGIRDDLDLGGQFSLIHRWLALSTPINPNPQLTGVPGAYALLYAVWRPLPNLSLSPNLQIATSRWSSNAANTGYVQEGGYALLNFKVEYKVTPALSVYGGGKNLTDRLYVLTDGYPEPGRTLYIGARYTF
jgi:iron complex outermembrane receptor protein